MSLNDVSNDLVPESLIPQTQIPGTETKIHFQMTQYPNFCCDKTLKHPLMILIMSLMTLMDDVTNDDDDQVIAAEGEKTASVALRAASDNIAGNHAAMQLRWKLFANCFSPLKNFKIFYPFQIFPHCQVPADPELDLVWEELHHHFPRANWHAQWNVQETRVNAESIKKPKTINNLRSLDIKMHVKCNEA